LPFIIQAHSSLASRITDNSLEVTDCGVPADWSNSHAVKPPKKGFGGRRLEYDHVHRHAKGKGVPYAFSSAGQLLTDFFSEVDQVLKEVL